MRTSPMTDSELIDRAQRGDVDAFCVLAANHQRSLYLLALKYCGNHHDAEDLTQEVMLSAFRSIKQFRGMSSFHTWLSRIMVNAFLNQKRTNDPLVQRVIGMLETIPPRQRLMFLMKHQEGLTCEEIAETMGTSVGTVKKTLFRVVDRLRQHFTIPLVKG